MVSGLGTGRWVCSLWVLAAVSYEKLTFCLVAVSFSVPSVSAPPRPTFFFLNKRVRVLFYLRIILNVFYTEVVETFFKNCCPSSRTRQILSNTVSPWLTVSTSQRRIRPRTQFSEPGASVFFQSPSNSHARPTPSSCVFVSTGQHRQVAPYQ
jgi:hypothetical protein